MHPHTGQQRAIRGFTASAATASATPQAQQRVAGAPAAAAAAAGMRGSSAAGSKRPGGRTAADTPVAAYLGALVVAMVGATYGSVPLYRLFCQATGAPVTCHSTRGGSDSTHRLLGFPAHSLPSHAGYGGTTQRAHSVEDAVERLENPDTAAKCSARNITITFNADVADGLPWRFVPTQRSVSVHPGESALAFYRATNTSSVPIVGVSTYNVAPARAGLYFRKVQCFCFEEQRLEPGEAVDMPVLFYLDPEFVDDPKCNAMNHVTLSYTFWKAGTSADAALEEAAARDFEVDAEAQEQKAAAGSAR